MPASTGGRKAGRRSILRVVPVLVILEIVVPVVGALRPRGPLQLVAVHALAVAEAGVERRLEDLAGPEGQHPPSGDLDLLARLRIAPHPRLLLADLEVAEAGDLDLVPPLQRLLHRVEHQLDDL